MDFFFDNMTREEVCRAYASDSLPDYSDKDFCWCAEYDFACQQSDEWLLEWCRNNF